MKKIIVLLFVKTYLPGFKSGGPVRSISNLVSQLGDVFEFRIVTSDRDSLDINSYSNIYLNDWNRIGKAWVYYLSKNNRGILYLMRLIRETHHDVLYLNSFFDINFSQKALLLQRFELLSNKPIILAPRGEFSVGALAIKSLRKKIFIFITTQVWLYKNVIWQATTDLERIDIHNTLRVKYKEIIIAQDMPQQPHEIPLRKYDVINRNREQYRIVFLSRISPIKNLDFALRVIAKLKIKVIFDIYGPIVSKSYWRYCMDLMKTIPLNVTVKYQDSVIHSKVLNILETYDLFFLPTYGENYGHVIIESMIVGTPVLIADTTPWRNLEQDGVGWELPLDDEQQFVNKIHAAAEISCKDYKRWRKKVSNYAHKRVINPQVLEANRKLFIEVTQSEQNKLHRCAKP
ncbi:MAG: glycosyltransferase [Methylococcaceae bacterium]